MEFRKTRTSRRAGALGLALLGLGLGTGSAQAAPESAALRAGIVTIRITGQEWNWKTPWSKQSPWSRTVTGLVVSGPRILVATASIGNHLLLEAQRLGEDLRTPARLVLSDPEGPLALLAVDDPAFWKGLQPLRLAEAVTAEGEVTVIAGYARASSIRPAPPCARCGATVTVSPGPPCSPWRRRPASTAPATPKYW